MEEYKYFKAKGYISHLQTQGRSHLSKPQLLTHWNHRVTVTRVALHAKNPLFAEERTLAIEEFKYALESWRQTLAFARFLVA